MAARAGDIHFDKEFEPQTGTPVTVAPGIVRITAPNASPYTFTGTNSFLVGHEEIAVVDPGPDEAAHMDALMAAIGGRRVAAILLTHTHKDHSRLAPRLGAATGAPLWFGGAHRLSRALREHEANPLQEACDWELRPTRTLGNGEVFDVDAMSMTAIATPGHCANHLCFGVVGTPYVLTGDHVMGWNSTLVAPPDGSMRDYYTSLDRLASAPFSRYLPAHGGPIADGPAHARALAAHRRLRDAQIRAAIKDGAGDIEDLLARIYPDLPETVRPAARMTLLGHVEYLEENGTLVVEHTAAGLRIRRGKAAGLEG
jgi:glyoxylase-like metal-dependent hydrolase (beta-lactamase superfamily II)